MAVAESTFPTAHPPGVFYVFHEAVLELGLLVGQIGMLVFFKFENSSARSVRRWGLVLLGVGVD
jgi:hypothetical protein